MIVLSGADLVLPDRILSPGTLTISNGRIAEIGKRVRPGSIQPDLHGHCIVPGFVDVHVHGASGADTLDDGDPVSAIAASLPRFGVTAFCPTTMACSPDALARVLLRLRSRGERAQRSARVLPAHVESGFISPEYRGAQPLACLASPAVDGEWLLRVIEENAGEVGIVTLAPELDGSPDLIARLSARGIRVSLGHSGATYEQARDGIAAGAVHATHLYNCMPSIHHRRPGLAGAVLESDEVAAEVVGDGVHVHPSVLAWTVAAKGATRVMAITDGTALMGQPSGAQATLGGQAVFVRDGAARLADGTLAGGVVSMDGVFRTLVRAAKLSPVAAATLCATTPARQLGVADTGVIAVDAIADLVVLDRDLAVVRTYIGGDLAYQRA